MKEFPHRYAITADSATAGTVRLTGECLPDLASASPAEFGGPGDLWSPETLLVAAVGDCFVLTFRAVAAASKLAWASLSCSVTGTLDRVERVTRFTAFEVRARDCTRQRRGIGTPRRRQSRTGGKNVLGTHSLRRQHLILAFGGTPPGRLWDRSRGHAEPWQHPHLQNHPHGQHDKDCHSRSRFQAVGPISRTVISRRRPGCPPAAGSCALNASAYCTPTRLPTYRSSALYLSIRLA